MFIFIFIYIVYGSDLARRRPRRDRFRSRVWWTLWQRVWWPGALSFMRCCLLPAPCLFSKRLEKVSVPVFIDIKRCI